MSSDSMKRTAVVTGGSRGLGRGIVEALAPKMRVVAVARDGAQLAEVAKATGAEPAVADVADLVAAGRLMQDLRPDLLVLCAGAAPLNRPIHQQTWETFSRNWEVDTKGTFAWVREALLLPMRPGSHVIVISSGAAVQGSALSGGYAGAKRTQWFIADYAAQESVRLKLGIRFHCLLPALNASTALGRSAIAAYAERVGVSIEEFPKRFGPPLTPGILGQAIVELAENPGRWEQLAYRVNGAGLVPVT